MTKKIIGIGNAIVDVICKTSDEFLQERGLNKGSMALIDEATADIFSKIANQEISAGGSVANTIDAISQLSHPASFIGKVAGDQFGQKFVSNLKASNTNFLYGELSKNKTATSFIFVTPDAQRTMCTHLGCASEIDENDIDENAVKSSSILYLEGYLWYARNTLPALQKAIKIAKENDVKIALNLSDFMCVTHNKEEFLTLIKNDLDIVIANEAEIQELLNSNNIAESNFQKLSEFFDKKIITVITRGEKGCIVVDDKKILEIPTDKVTPVDTTGAGDAFAAGFLFGLLQDFSLEKSARIGNILAGRIIQKYGARFTKEEILTIKAQI